MKNQKDTNIISFLNKHYAQHNVFFGELIHQLKPSSIYEWKEYLIKHNWFFIKDMSSKGYSKWDKERWIWYLKNSFWKLYTSETKAIEWFKQKLNINLEFAPRNLDLKYGIDFIYNSNNFIIVKTSIYDEEVNKFLDYKKLNQFSYGDLNNANSVIWVFESSKERLFRYDYDHNTLELVHLQSKIDAKC